MIDYERRYFRTFVRTKVPSYVPWVVMYGLTNGMYVLLLYVHMFFINKICMIDTVRVLSSNRNNSKQLNTKVRKYNSIIIKVS